MTINQIEPLYTTLKSLSEKELSIFLSYKIAKILNKVEMDYQFYLEKLRSVLSKYGKKDENGQLEVKGDKIQIQPEFFSDAEAALNELNSLEMEPLEIKLTLKELEEANITITPSQLQALLPIIEE